MAIGHAQHPHQRKYNPTVLRILKQPRGSPWTFHRASVKTAPRIACVLQTLQAGEYEGLCNTFCGDWSDLFTVNSQNQLLKPPCRTKPNTENKVPGIKIQIENIHSREKGENSCRSWTSEKSQEISESKPDVLILQQTQELPLECQARKLLPEV